MDDAFEAMRGLYGDWCFGLTRKHTSEPGRNVPVGNNGDGQNHGETGALKCGGALPSIHESADFEFAKRLLGIEVKIK